MQFLRDSGGELGIGGGEVGRKKTGGRSRNGSGYGEIGQGSPIMREELAASGAVSRADRFQPTICRVRMSAAYQTSRREPGDATVADGSNKITIAKIRKHKR